MGGEFFDHFGALGWFESEAIELAAYEFLPIRHGTPR